MHTSNNQLSDELAKYGDASYFQIGSTAASSSEQCLVVPVPLRLDYSSALGTDVPSGGPGAIARRILDVLLSLALVIVLLPVMLLICLAIVLTGGGSPVYAHRRICKHGRPFPCYKFRSMRPGADGRLATMLADNPALRAEWARDFKLSNDPRVTKVGQFLRVTSLDELPQLINVLRGDMSLIGPRPIIDAELARYGRFAYCYLNLKPGLSGLWQVIGRSKTTYSRRVAADLLYYRKRSVVLDCRILLATVPAVLLGKGAC
jgi:exopolysaccharide production protein ExoY